MSKSQLTSQSTPGALRVDSMPSWSHLLGDLDEDACDFDEEDIAELNIPAGTVTEYDADRIYRAQVARVDKSKIDSAHLDALRHFEAEVQESTNDPVESAVLMSRLATLIGVTGLPWELVLGAFSSGGIKRHGEKRNYAALWYQGHLSLLDFLDDNEAKPAEPAFESDQYPEMAAYLMSRGLDKIRSRSDREFVAEDGSRISCHHIDAFIQQHLEKCFIYDRHRNFRLAVSNRLIAEVRGAFARKCPVLLERSTVDVEPHSFAEPDTFFDHHLAFDPSAWTPSEEFWSFYQHQSRCAALFSKEAFFKRVVNYGAGRIYPTRKKIGGKRVPGYAGFRIKSGT